MALRLGQVHGVPSSRVTLDFNVAMSACTFFSCGVAVAKASGRVLFMFVKKETVLQSEAAAVARLPSTLAVWDWMPSKVTELVA